MKGQNTEQTKNILQQQTIISFVSMNPEQPQPEKPSKASSVAGLDSYMEAETRQARDTIAERASAQGENHTKTSGYEDGGC